MLTSEQARELLDSIDTSTVVGLRDRALISVMTFGFARIGAAVAMRVEDYYPKGKRWWVRLHEKGGKRHEMPAHHNLEALPTWNSGGYRVQTWVSNEISMTEPDLQRPPTHQDRAHPRRAYGARGGPRHAA